MTTTSHPHPLRRWLAAAVSLIAIVVGAVWGYDFGHQVGGVLFGWVTGALGALFCSILVDAVLQHLRAPRRR